MDGYDIFHLIEDDEEVGRIQTVATNFVAGSYELVAFALLKGSMQTAQYSSDYDCDPTPQGPNVFPMDDEEHARRAVKICSMVDGTGYRSDSRKDSDPSYC